MRVDKSYKDYSNSGELPEEIWLNDTYEDNKGQRWYIEYWLGSKSAICRKIDLDGRYPDPTMSYKKSLFELNKMKRVK